MPSDSNMSTESKTALNHATAQQVQEHRHLDDSLLGHLDLL
jgi:hypothetical protein